MGKVVVLYGRNRKQIDTSEQYDDSRGAVKTRLYSFIRECDYAYFAYDKEPSITIDVVGLAET